MTGLRAAVFSVLASLSAFGDADPPRLVITEVMTDPRIEYGCYVEVHNLGPTPAPLDGLCLQVHSRMIELAPFEEEVGAEIPPDGFAVVLEGEYTRGYEVPEEAIRLRDAGLVARLETGSTIAVCYRNGEVLSSWRMEEAASARGEAWVRDDPANEGQWAGWHCSAELSPGRRNRSLVQYFTQPGVPSSAVEQALVAQIDGASESIDVAAYELDRVAVVEALCRAADRLGEGAVRIVTEFYEYSQDEAGPVFALFEAAGIDVVTDLDGQSRLFHHKFFVFDEKRCWTGSLNLTDRGFGVQPNDAVLIHSPEVAAAFHGEFEEVFGGTFGNEKVDDTEHEFEVDGVDIEVYFSPSDPARERLLEALKGAKTSIDLLINHLTDPDIMATVVERSQSGVRVRAVFDWMGATRSASRDIQETLTDGGVRIRYWGNTQQFMHMKAAVVDAEGDGAIVLTGSYNYSLRASKENDENLIVIHGRETAAAYQEQFRGLWSEATDSPEKD